MNYRSNISYTNAQRLKQIKSNANLDNIKSNFIFKKIIEHVQKRKSYDIMRYNKKLQRRLNITFDDYKECSKIYSSIEIELNIVENRYGIFINIPDKDKEYYHIYFDNSNEEIKRNKLKDNEKVKLIKIKIDYQVKSFERLFSWCNCIDSIYFKKFFRNNIINMSGMFCGCSSLKELNLSNFNTDNVTNMSKMFYYCSSLKELNLSNFNTDNVTNISEMFYYCSSLKKLNLSNFNTNKVTNMSDIFDGCSDELKNKIKEQNKNIII